MQSVGNSSSNIARLSYTSTSSCDSYSAYHRSKAEDKIYYLRDILTPCEFDTEVDIVMERMARKAEEEAARGSKMHGRLIKKIKNIFRLNRLYDDVPSINLEITEPRSPWLAVAESNSLTSKAYHKSMAGAGSQIHSIQISSRRWPEQTMILAGLSTFYSSHGDWQTTALFPIEGF
ncbi:hypothetical protein V491_07308 [Pseudogymnoascus sp. VKM F-3775]|nr:hypothetical protein V491_07308 [Pseudogymnoascus sp. VKM F-3775]